MNENNENNLIIYQKYLDLIYYTNDILRKFPKHEKFALVQELKKTLYEGLRYLIFAQKEFNKNNRLKYLNYLDASLNLIKIHIRLSYKYQYINMNNYSTWSLKLTDICNLLGAWIKSCLKK